MPALVACVVVCHVHHCPRPRTVVRPCPLVLASLALALAPSSALACVPLTPRPSLLPSTTTAITAVDDHHLRCHTFDDDDRQKPVVIVRHRWRQWQSLSNAVAVNGCGGNGVFATTVNDDDRRCRLHPTATSVDNDRRGQRPSLPPPISTAAAFDDDRHRRRERRRLAP